jgi:hypothetical protein
MTLGSQPLELLNDQTDGTIRERFPRLLAHFNETCPGVPGYPLGRRFSAAVWFYGLVGLGWVGWWASNPHCPPYARRMQIACASYSI